MRRVLIISPNFPPVNAADHQRVRTSLPYFKDFGWAPTILSVAPEYNEFPRDDFLTLTVPSRYSCYLGEGTLCPADPQTRTREPGVQSDWIAAAGGEQTAGRKRIRFDLFFDDCFSAVGIGAEMDATLWGSVCGGLSGSLANGLLQAI